jgi:hypothetical protein
MQIIWQCPQSALTKQQIDILQTDLFCFLEEEENNWKCDTGIPGCRDSQFCSSVQVKDGR